MSAPKGNKFWMARSTHGPKPKFEDAQALLRACHEYFEWVHANPLWQPRAFVIDGKWELKDVPKLRAMTLHGLCLFLDIERSTWDGYRRRKSFGEAVAKVESVIRTQKFEGAAAFMFNGSIIARDLRLGEPDSRNSREATVSEAPVTRGKRYAEKFNDHVTVRMDEPAAGDRTEATD